MNFTLDTWERFCSTISYRRTILGKEIPTSNFNDWLVIKHDVEANPERALNIAKIENRHGLKCTYYVQGDLLEKYPGIFKEISNLGHEVTYHYDVLDANDGNIEKASEEFSMYLKKFSELGLDVESVCPHGNPVLTRNGWESNRDFFKNVDVRIQFPNIFDIVLDTHKHIDTDILYISDAGYGFNVIKDIKSGQHDVVGDTVVLDSVDRLVDYIHQHKYVIISTHPHRWFKSAISYNARRVFFKYIRRVVVKFYKYNLVKRILSPFYALARKI